MGQYRRIDETRQALAGDRKPCSKGGIQKALDVLRDKGLVRSRLWQLCA